MPAKTEVLGIATEFNASMTGDKRRTKRVQAIATAIAAKPGESLPKALGTVAAREGAYKLFENDAVDFAGLIDGHFTETSRRAEQVERVLVAHDTTTFKFSTPRAGLGPTLGENSKGGFYLHASLVITPDAPRDPLGLVAAQPWTRTEQVKAMRGSEMERWSRGVKAAESNLPSGTHAVHLMDREGDSYELFSKLAGHDFIIRACHDRVCSEGAMFDLARSAVLVATRQVTLSARKEPKTPKAKKIYPARRQRTAQLEVRATPVTIRRSSYLHGRTDLPDELELNLVHVVEKACPDGFKPVEWFLFSTLPIDTPEAVLTIVDGYRGRWMIEEFFKALKTGCKYQSLQLESYEALLRALAIYISVAWLLLRIRYLAGECSAETPALTVFNEIQLEILRIKTPKSLPANPTLRQALLALAALGGHIRRNGEPGWLVLGRGLHDLILMEQGFNMSLLLKKSDQS